MQQLQSVYFTGKSKNQEVGCCGSAPGSSCGGSAELKPVRRDASDEVCCGSPPGPGAGEFERAGYEIYSFVEDFEKSEVGPVPRIKTSLDRRDILGAIRVRLGFGRDDYKVSPGLYCAGRPASDSPVLVTANYKLTLDCLRRELGRTDAWILVVDTRGINVWCAAGKGTFSTEEVIERVKIAQLDKIVSRKTLVLPQLSATGVSALSVKRGCGFKVVWGPAHVRNLERFLKNDMKAEPSMRNVTFTLTERFILTPVELSQIGKPTFWILLVLFLLSGIGPDILSLSEVWQRGFMAAVAYFLGVLAGAVVTPVLLPWIPGKAFSFKGGFIGLLFGVVSAAVLWDKTGFIGALALILIAGAISSFLAMNFTGATPFTSPSGVEKEMRKAIPVQIGAVLAGIVLWIGAAFSM